MVSHPSIGGGRRPTCNRTITENSKETGRTECVKVRSVLFAGVAQLAERRICTPKVVRAVLTVSSTNRVCACFPGWLLCIAGAGLWLDHLPRHITHVAAALARFIAGAWGKMPGGEAGMISLSEDGSIPSKRRGSTATGPAGFDQRRRK